VYWPEVRRGTERFAHELATGLLAAGHAPRIVTGHAGPPRTTVEDGVPVVRVPRLPEGRLERRMYEQHLTHLPFAYAALRRRADDPVRRRRHAAAQARRAARAGVRARPPGAPRRAPGAQPPARRGAVRGRRRRVARPRRPRRAGRRVPRGARRGAALGRRG